MAERYEGYKRKKRSSSLASTLAKQAPKADPAATYDPNKQAEGYEKRLTESGINVEAATDKRGLIEKGLNLPEGQNIFFDLFEVLGRPQQALFAGINAVQQGGTFGDGFKKGLTGEDYVNFSKILNDAGMGDDQSFGLDDVLGFAGDIFLDPVDLALLAATPVTGGASTALLVANKTMDAIRTGKTAGKIARAAAGDAVQSMKNIAKRMKAKAIDTAQSTGKMYQQLGKNIVEGGKMVGQGKVFRGSAKIAGNVLAPLSSKVMKLSDGTVIQRFGATDVTMSLFKKSLQFGGKTSYYLARTGVTKFAGDSAAAAMDDITKAIQGTINNAIKFGDDLANEVKAYISKKSGGKVWAQNWALSVQKKLRAKSDDMYKIAKEQAEAAGQVFTTTADEFFETINKEVFEYGEVGYQSTTNIGAAINSPNKYEIHLDADMASEVRALMDSPVFTGLGKNNQTLFDTLYYKDVLPNGREIYVLRRDIGADELINKFNERLTQVNNIIGDTQRQILRNGSTFAFGSKTEKQIKNLLATLQAGGLPQGSRLLNKSFDEIFELDNGAYRIIDQAAYDELMETVNIAERGKKAISGPVYRTQAELDALKQKYANGFENQELYDEILSELEKAMTYMDARYGTAMYTKTQGWMHHAVTDDAKELLDARYAYNKYKTDNPIDPDGTYLMGNSKAFQGRKYNMTASEANMLAQYNAQKMVDYYTANPDKITKLNELDYWTKKSNVQLFSEYFTDSFADTLLKMNEYGAAIKIMDTALVKGSLEGDDVIRLGSQVGDKAPVGFQRVNAKTLKEKILSMTEVYGDNADMLKFVENILGNEAEVFIDSNVFDMIGRIGGQVTPKISDYIVDIMVATNNVFKKTKLFSAGFQVKNLLGNITNLYLAGVNPWEIGKVMKDGLSASAKYKRIMEIFAEGGEEAIRRLSQDEQKIYNVLRIFIDGGMADAKHILYDVDSLLGKAGKEFSSPGQAIKNFNKNRKNQNIGASGLELVNMILDTNAWANGKVDDILRMGYISRLVDEGLTDEQVLAKVKLALFDPSDLTKTEKDVYRKIIPFYTFAKKNIAYHMANVTQNPVRYKRLLKGIRTTWDWAGVDYETEVADYQKENMWIPIPLTKTKDGKYLQLKANLPAGDFAEFIQNPGNKILSSLAPYIRAPFELATNRQIFTGMDIESFQGQRGRTLPWVPGGARGEYILGQTGLDRPIQTIQNLVKTTTGQTQTLAESVPSVFGQGDVEKARISQGYERLNELKDLMKYYKQEQIPILTLTDIENRNKRQDTLAQRLAAIQSRRSR